MSDRLDFPRGELRAHVVRGTVGQRDACSASSTLLVLAQGLIVTRLLGPEAIGLYGVVTVTAMTIVSLKRVGIDEAFVAQEAADQETEFQRAFTLELALSAGFALVLLAAAPVVAAVYDDDRLLALTAATAYLPLAFALQAPPWVFFRRMDYARQRLLQAVVPVVSLRGHRAARRGRRRRVEPRHRPGGRQPRGHRRGARAPRRTALRAALRPRRRAALPALLGARCSSRSSRRSSSRRARSSRSTSHGGLDGGRLHHARRDADALHRPRRPDRHGDDLPGDLRDPGPHARRSRSCSCGPTARRCCGSLPAARASCCFAGDLVDLRARRRVATRRVGLMQGLAVATALGQLGFNWFSFYRAHERTRPPAVEAVVAAVAFLALAVPGLRACRASTGFVVGRCAAVAVQLGVRARYVRALLPAVRGARPAGAPARADRRRRRRGARAARSRCGAQAGLRPRRSPRSRSSAPSSSALSLRLERGLLAELVARRPAAPARQSRSPARATATSGEGGHLPVPVQAGVQGPGERGGGGPGGEGAVGA